MNNWDFVKKAILAISILSCELLASIYNIVTLLNLLTTGKDHFWSPSYLSLRQIEIAVIFWKYEK